MLVIPRAVRVYFATAPANLRKSFEGLSNEVRAVLAKDPLAGHVFVFLNRRKNQVKLLVWTRGGYTIVHKRLERGKFVFTSKVADDVTAVELDVHELSARAHRSLPPKERGRLDGPAAPLLERADGRDCE
jgi:transposase